MNTLQVYNGDIQLESGGRLAFVTGSNKLVQDLSLWLREDLGVGYTTPNFGSLLNSMIGQALTPSALTQVYVEVKRVLENYRANQILQLKDMQNLKLLGNYRKSEIIQSINSVQVTPSNASALVEVSITTLSNNIVNLNLLLTANGIQVQNG